MKRASFRDLISLIRYLANLERTSASGRINILGMLLAAILAIALSFATMFETLVRLFHPNAYLGPPVLQILAWFCIFTIICALMVGYLEGRQGLAAQQARADRQASEPRTSRKSSACPAKDGPAGHVFLSYCREDSAKVDWLQGILEGAGIRVWRDKTALLPGDHWRAAIRHAVTDNALVFLACFSTASIGRKQSGQNEELTVAVEQMRLRPPEEPWLIPVRFDDCEIPNYDVGTGRTLRSIQRSDLFGPEADAQAARLVTAVQRILGRAADGMPGHDPHQPNRAGDATWS